MEENFVVKVELKVLSVGILWDVLREETTNVQFNQTFFFLMQ
jgi:hypothetical protein